MQARGVRIATARFELQKRTANRISLAVRMLNFVAWLTSCKTNPKLPCSDEALVSIHFESWARTSARLHRPRARQAANIVESERATHVSIGEIPRELNVGRLLPGDNPILRTGRNCWAGVARK